MNAPESSSTRTRSLRPLVVKATCGTDRAETLNQALTVAATAVAAGADVSLWLTGDASWLAVPDHASRTGPDLPHAMALTDLFDTVLEAGRITVCTQCAVRRDLTEADLVPGVRIAGAAVFVEESLAPDVQALVY